MGGWMSILNCLGSIYSSEGSRWVDGCQYCFSLWESATRSIVAQVNIVLWNNIFFHLHFFIVIQPKTLSVGRHIFLL